MSKILKNTTNLDIFLTDIGTNLVANSSYTIPVLQSYLFASSNDLFYKIGSGDVVVNDGTYDLSISDGIDLLKGYSQKYGTDPDTGKLAVTSQTLPSGWALQQFETEYELSKLNSIHEKTWDNSNIGWSSLKFYEGTVGSETEITGANLNQTYLDSNCNMTELWWMPDEDYIIFGGYASQLESPTEDVYSWTSAPHLDAAYGGSQHLYTEGGINLRFQNSKYRHGIEKQSGTLLKYSHPTLGDGKGTNRFVFRFRHSAGYNLRVQSLFIIAREI